MKMTEDEIDRLVAGDVLQMPSGTYRVLRNVGISRNNRSKYFGQPFNFSFAIKRCSWTTRPSTTYSRSDIRQWKRVGVRVKLDQDIDDQFLIDLRARDSSECAISCCQAGDMP